MIKRKFVNVSFSYANNSFTSEKSKPLKYIYISRKYSSSSLTINETIMSLNLIVLSMLYKIDEQVF